MPIYKEKTSEIIVTRVFTDAEPLKTQLLALAQAVLSAQDAAPL